MVSQHQNNSKQLRLKSFLSWVKARLKYNEFYPDIPLKKKKKSSEMKKHERKRRRKKKKQKHPM